jgi:hypothetical protein
VTSTGWAAAFQMVCELPLRSDRLRLGIMNTGPRKTHAGVAGFSPSEKVPATATDAALGYFLWRNASIDAVATIPSTLRARSASSVMSASACSCVSATYSAL